MFLKAAWKQFCKGLCAPLLPQPVTDSPRPPARRGPLLPHATGLPYVLPTGYHQTDPVPFDLLTKPEICLLVPKLRLIALCLQAFVSPQPSSPRFLVVQASPASSAAGVAVAESKPKGRASKRLSAGRPSGRQFYWMVGSTD